MSHPLPGAPAEQTVGRLDWLIDDIRTNPSRYESRELAALRGSGMALVVAAERELMSRERP